MVDNRPVPSRMRASVGVTTQEGGINPDDLFNALEEVRASLREQAPSNWERFFNSDARARGKAIEELKRSTIETRTAYVKGLGDVLQVYINVHKGDLIEKGFVHLAGNITEQTSALLALTQRAAVNLVTAVDDSVDHIRLLRHLSEEQKDAMVVRSFARAFDAEEDLFRQMRTLLDTITERVRRMVEGLGQR